MVRLVGENVEDGDHRAGDRGADAEFDQGDAQMLADQWIIGENVIIQVLSAQDKAKDTDQGNPTVS